MTLSNLNSNFHQMTALLLNYPFVFIGNMPKLSQLNKPTNQRVARCHFWVGSVHSCEFSIVSA